MACGTVAAMGLVIAGIDEAGYGPLLGPMCVGMAVLRVENWNEGDAAPDLWKELAPAICRKPAKGKGGVASIPIADSKKLKLANDVIRGHPVMHLERGVLTLLSASGSELPSDDGVLFERLGTKLGGHECYAAGNAALPLAWSAGQLSIGTNVVRGALERAGVSVLALACEVTPEPEFNEIVEQRGTKAAVTVRSIARHMRTVWQRWGGTPDHVRIVCDRLGGRERYAAVLERIARRIDGAAAARVLEETPTRSRYMVEGPTGRVGVSFEVEGEDAHLPVALASMIAKYVRELAMARFNRYWTARMQTLGAEIKPTAGYSQDGRRWLRDAAAMLTDEDKRLLVRRA